MTTRSATLLVARAAIIVPLLLGAMGGRAVGAGFVGLFQTMFGDEIDRAGFDFG